MQSLSGLVSKAPEVSLTFVMMDEYHQALLPYIHLWWSSCALCMLCSNPLLNRGEFAMVAHCSVMKLLEAHKCYQYS
jgi:hypothetical protein